ncbi:MAG TPA: hypothetical protein VFA07_03510 [Chthonomonadaceae bacterium]|nr:hypothetical protein [Chthonomonadaceae bacterium]
MRCSNCGKDIPFSGTVCPYCKANKQGDQIGWALANVLGFVFGIIGAFIGDAIWGFGGGVAGFIVGFITGVIMGFIQGDKATKNIRAAAQIKAQAAEQTRIDTEAVASRMAYPQQEYEMLASGAYKKCPHCAEVIRSEASVCRFCGRDVAQVDSSKERAI